MVRPGVVAAAVLVLVLAVSGCGVVGSRSDQRPPPAADPASEFAQDMSGAVSVAEQFWGDQFRSAGRRFTPIPRVLPYRNDGEITCGQQEIPRNNAVYCPAGDFIAYDVNWAATAFRRIGDAFLYYLLGHEYAHGIQVRLGLECRFTIEQELQADCLSGAYLGGSVKAGLLRLEPGDVDELRAGLLAVGDDPGQPWFAPGAHGTPEQRTRAFATGYDSGVRACSLAP